jgi:translation initiation factor IF-2
MEEQQRKFADSKKSQFKDTRTRRHDGNSEEEDKGRKVSRRNSEDRNDRFMQNLHTIVFSNDGSLDDFSPRRGIGAFKRKNNGGDKQSKQKIFQTVNIPDLISVSDLADRMNEKKADVVKKLFTMGMKVNVNQILDADVAELIVVDFGHAPRRVSDSDVEKTLGSDEKPEGSYMARSPVVTVMGHVDHGKTSLLDALRSSNVAEKESGGITQHIGASTVELDNDKFITFIDTPGHEAFTEMRIRGANITDIVVLVVAADDGIKEQTIEAINHIKAANVPMIVAINKIDKADSNPEKVKQDLLQHNVILEDFGGSVMSIGVSAKNKTNIDKLLEMILLQAEILELKAPIDCKAGGSVIESKMDPKKGAVCSLLVQKGILQVGDIIVAGTSYGKIKTMVDDKDNNRKKVYPSRAVEVLGFNSNPLAGDIFNVVESEKEARDIITYRSRKSLEERDARRGAGSNMETLLQEVKDSSKKRLSVVVKADVSGSVEAIVSSLAKLNTEEVEVNAIHYAIGAVSESDVNLAQTSNAIIVAFNVRANADVRSLAQHRGIEIKYYSIIYNIIDDIRDLMSGLLNPTLREEIIGQAEIRNVIKVVNIGKIAGCYVLSGEMLRNSNVRIIRDNIVIFSGKMKSLRRFKDDVKEVKAGFECGVAVENYDDIREKDVIECYRIVEEKRSL